MALQNATANLQAEFTIFPQTGFIEYRQGQIDPATGYIKPLNDSRWGALSGNTWGNWTNFNSNPLPIIWSTDVVDLGEVRYFTLSIQAEFDGSINYSLYVSDTGAFAGEETEHVLEEGNQNIPAFYGRYFRLTARCPGKEIRRISMEASNAEVEVFLQDVNTATLAGTASNRVLTLPRTVSAIKEMAVHVKAATPYAVNLYVSDTATSEVLIPVVKSKSGSSPSFALYGIDNDPRDGVVDISIKGLPRQALIGGSLYVL